MSDGNPAPADGDLVERLAMILAKGRATGSHCREDARAVLAEMAKSEGAPINQHDLEALIAERDDAKATIATLEAELALKTECKIEHMTAAGEATRELESVRIHRDKLIDDLATMTRELDHHKNMSDGRLRCIDSLTRELAEAKEQSDKRQKARLVAEMQLAEAREELRLTRSQRDAATMMIGFVAVEPEKPVKCVKCGGTKVVEGLCRGGVEDCKSCGGTGFEKPDSGGERACVADEGVPRVGALVRVDWCEGTRFHAGQEVTVHCCEAARSWGERYRDGEIFLCDDPSKDRALCRVTVIRRAQPAPQAKMLALNDALPHEQALAAAQDAAPQTEPYQYPDNDQRKFTKMASVAELNHRLVCVEQRLDIVESYQRGESK